VQKRFNQLPVNVIFVYHPLKTVQDRIRTELPFQGIKRVGAEARQEQLLILVVKGVDNLIRKPHKSIYGVYGRMVLAVKDPDPQRETGGIAPGGQARTFQSGFRIKVHHPSILSATSLELITAIGRPVPGTVEAPV
jgi:hypothetical protein